MDVAGRDREVRRSDLPAFRATVAEVGSGVGLVSVSGELDLYAESDLRGSLAAADGLGVATIVVDLSGVSFLDSTICGLLVGEAKRRRNGGSGLVLVTNGAPTSRVLELAGIDRVVPTFSTLHEALQELLLESSR